MKARKTPSSTIKHLWNTLCAVADKKWEFLSVSRMTLRDPWGAYRPESASASAGTVLEGRGPASRCVSSRGTQSQRYPHRGPASQGPFPLWKSPSAVSVFATLDKKPSSPFTTCTRKAQPPLYLCHHPGPSPTTWSHAMGSPIQQKRTLVKCPQQHPAEAQTRQGPYWKQQSPTRTPSPIPPTGNAHQGSCSWTPATRNAHHSVYSRTLAT